MSDGAAVGLIAAMVAIGAILILVAFGRYL